MAPFVGGALVVVVITISCGGVGNSALKNMIAGNSIILMILTWVAALT